VNNVTAGKDNPILILLIVAVGLIAMGFISTVKNEPNKVYATVTFVQKLCSSTGCSKEVVFGYGANTRLFLPENTNVEVGQDIYLLKECNGGRRRPCKYSYIGNKTNP
jgi:hypothetical protein